MSLAIIHTRASIGIQAPPVRVEVHISNGMPAFTLVGLPEATVKEARDRVRSALMNSGFSFPPKRITVSLAPADLPKEGGRFDLPIALGILAASQQIPDDQLNQHEFLGELALSGELRAIRGALPAILAVNQYQRTLILPQANADEAGLITSGQQKVASHLLEVCAYLHHEQDLQPAPPFTPVVPASDTQDLQDIIGQEHAKRALEIAAAGGHNLLLIGPPGTGKTMLASRLRGLIPPLTEQQALESAVIHSVGLHTVSPHHWQTPPFRNPHHGVSQAALVGGGSLPRPGELSLAHNGILFLDELPEFERRVLDALREPLETGEITISRATAKVTFPAKVQLVAAMNPSPTGQYQGIHNRSQPQQILRYLNRLSGPFLDRFDLSVEVPLLPEGTLSQPGKKGANSADIRQRVLQARNRQLQRADKINAHLNNPEIERFCSLETKDAKFLEDTLAKLSLSVRAWHRIIKVARTIADLEGAETIQRSHLAEALSYRSMDRFLIQLYKMLG